MLSHDVEVLSAHQMHNPHNRKIQLKQANMEWLNFYKSSEHRVMNSRDTHMDGTLGKELNEWCGWNSGQRTQWMMGTELWAKNPVNGVDGTLGKELSEWCE